MTATNKTWLDRYLAMSQVTHDIYELAQHLPEDQGSQMRFCARVSLALLLAEAELELKQHEIRETITRQKAKG